MPPGAYIRGTSIYDALASFPPPLYSARPLCSAGSARPLIGSFRHERKYYPPVTHVRKYTELLTISSKANMIVLFQCSRSIKSGPKEEVDGLRHWMFSQSVQTLQDLATCLPGWPIWGNSLVKISHYELIEIQTSILLGEAMNTTKYVYMESRRTLKIPQDNFFPDGTSFLESTDARCFLHRLACVELQLQVAMLKLEMKFGWCRVAQLQSFFAALQRVSTGS